MTRGRKMKREYVELDSDLPTPPQSSQHSHRQDSAMTEMPLRAGSQPASMSGTSSTFAAEPTLAAEPVSTAANGQDVEMTETPAREAMETMADQSRQLIQVIQKLEALNIKSTLPSLPMFVVIGDQSAGKSSIIEAACDITLPRNEGTCTRCPFKITTTASKNGEPWQCQISLHQDYAYMPGRLAGQDSTFDNWLNQDRVIHKFGDLVLTKPELDLALRRAQLAVLNPNQDPQTYVNMPLHDQTSDSQRVGFSPNSISLEITAPGLPEMSFYDLPGAINTLPDQSQQYLVKFVELLLKNYISNDKAYILLACAASQDLDTSTAFRFLDQCNARNRAMGIYTKPDLIHFTEKRLASVQKLLRGTQYQLGDGWFVTRQLAQQEINDQNLTHTGARQVEAAFFAGEPWTTQLAEFSPRFGIPNLSTAISRKLTAHILQDLPKIVERVVSRLTAVENQLSLFPERAIAPVLTVFTEIANVKAAITSQINPDRFTGTFRSEFLDVLRDFSKQLKSLKPVVQLSTPGHRKPSISLSSDEEESPTKSRRTNGGSRSISMTPNHSAQKRVRRTPAGKQSNEASGSSVAKTVFRLDVTKAKFDSAPGADIPGQVSEGVVRNLMREALNSWANIPEATIKKIHAIFREMLHSTITEALPQYQNTEFCRRVKEVAFVLLEELIEAVMNTVVGMVAAETHRPLTHNGSLMKTTRLPYAQDLRQRRNALRVEEHYEDEEAKGHKVPTKVDQQKKAAELLKNELDDDDYDREVKALATPLAYYEIASAQLVDGIAKQVELGLMHSFESRIQTKLYEDLRAGKEDKCAELLAEDPATERQRAQLLQEKDSLGKALAELNSLPNLHA